MNKFNPKRPKTSARRFKDRRVKLAIREFEINKDGKRTGNYTALRNVHECIESAVRRGQ